MTVSLDSKNPASGNIAPFDYESRVMFGKKVRQQNLNRLTNCDKRMQANPTQMLGTLNAT
jgi:hypothetical protein